MKQYSPVAAQEDFLEILSAIHQLKETILITPTDERDEHAAVVLPLQEWQALSELAFLEAPAAPIKQNSRINLTSLRTDQVEWG